jgi:hypothetical protein
MLGLGKIISGFFESIGMGWMGNVLSLATNFMMGNWVGVAQDIFRLVSEFSNDSWRDKVDRFQPLGSFSRGSSCFGNSTSSLSESRLSDLRTQAEGDGDEFSVTIRRSLDETSFSLRMQAELNANRWMANGTARA